MSTLIIDIEILIYHDTLLIKRRHHLIRFTNTVVLIRSFFALTEKDKNLFDYITDEMTLLCRRFRFEPFGTLSKQNAVCVDGSKSAVAKSRAAATTTLKTAFLNLG